MKFDTLSELLAWKPPEQKYIISNGIFLPGTKLILGGDTETYKTLLSTHTAFLLSQGKLWFGYNTTKQVVAMLQAELPKAVFRDRIYKYATGHQAYPEIHFRTELDMKLDKPVGLANLATELKRIKATVLIIDPLYKVISGNISDSFDIGKLLDQLDILCWQFGLAIWLVHHRRKNQIYDGEKLDLGVDDLMGSSSIAKWADTIIKVSREESSDDILVKFIKTRNADKILSPFMLRLNRDNLGFNQLVDITKEVR